VPRTLNILKIQRDILNVVVAAAAAVAAVVVVVVVVVVVAVVIYGYFLSANVATVISSETYSCIASIIWSYRN
jgi:hypothetical protein